MVNENTPNQNAQPIAPPMSTTHESEGFSSTHGMLEDRYLNRMSAATGSSDTSYQSSLDGESHRLKSQKPTQTMNDSADNRRVTRRASRMSGKPPTEQLEIKKVSRSRRKDPVKKREESESQRASQLSSLQRLLAHCESKRQKLQDNTDGNATEVENKDIAERVDQLPVSNGKGINAKDCLMLTMQEKLLNAENIIRNEMAFRENRKLSLDSTNEPEINA